jgi:hypothetical protein
VEGPQSFENGRLAVVHDYRISDHAETETAPDPTQVIGTPIDLDDIVTRSAVAVVVDTLLFPRVTVNHG